MPHVVIQDGSDAETPLLESCLQDASANGGNGEALLGTPNSSISPHKKSSAWQTTATLLSLQLGWGLWLLPSDFARLGWLPAAGKASSLGKSNSCVHRYLHITLLM